MAASMTLDDIVETGIGGGGCWRDELVEMRDAQNYGILLSELRHLRVNKVKCWSRLQPFRWRVDFEEQVLERFECSREGSHFTCTGHWSLKGAVLRRVSDIRKVPILGIKPGTALILTTRQAAGERLIYLCADEPWQVNLFESLIATAADRLKYLHKKMGNTQAGGEEGGAGRR